MDRQIKAGDKVQVEAFEGTVTADPKPCVSGSAAYGVICQVRDDRGVVHTLFVSQASDSRVKPVTPPLELHPGDIWEVNGSEMVVVKGWDGLVVQPVDDRREQRYYALANAPGNRLEAFAELNPALVRRREMPEW